MKNSLQDLAIVGSPPLFSQPLHVGRPNIGDRARLFERISTILDSRQLSNSGSFVRELELRVSELTGAKHCVAVCNATIGLDIVYRAAGLSGEVIVPSFTFVATVHALRWQGITPVFCDVDPDTGNIDAKHAESLMSPRTTGIVGVHVWGRPCNIEALQALAERHELRLIFDAAHAFGCTWHGRSIGTFGNAEVFSFHATKFINSFEGGMIATNDEEIALRARSLRNFGYTDKGVMGVGTNGKMSEVAAAMGVTSLEAMPQIVEVNKHHWEAYITLLSGVQGVELIPHPNQEKCNFQYVPIVIDEARFGLSRDQLYDVLQAEQVLARKYFWPGCHRLEPYRSEQSQQVSLPHTDQLAASVLCLPTGTGVSAEEVAGVCSLISIAGRHAEALRSRLTTAY